MTWRRWFGALPPHERWVAVYAVAFLGLLALVGSEGGVLTSLSSVMYFGMGAATIWSQIQVATGETVERGRRRAWFLLASSSVALWIGGIVWTAWDYWRVDALPSVIGLYVDYLYVPLALVGFLAFPADPRFDLRDRRARFDTALFILGGTALSWHFALLPLLQSAGGFSVVAAMPVLLEWGVAIAAAAAFLRSGDARSRAAIAFMLAGHLVYTLADYFWAAAGPTYEPGHWADAFWFLAWVLRWLGARRALRPAKAPTLWKEEYLAGLAPSIFVVSVYVLLLVALEMDRTGSVLDVALAASGMTVLLLMRHRVALAENRDLARETAQQADRFRALVASATDYVLVVDESWQVSYASPSLERVSGNLRGADFLGAVHPDDRGAVRLWMATHSRVSDARALRCRLRVIDAGWRDVEFRTQDRRDDPLVRGFLLNGRDITAELALEGELGHARKLVTLSDMAGRIAHAFNNTLAILQGHAEILLDEFPPGSTAHSDVQGIADAAERGAGITRQLLGFSRRHVIRPQLVRPGESIARLRPTLDQLLPATVVLEVRVAAPSAAVLVDSAQFEQVLVNLVANARDSMPDGGRLRLDVSERHAAEDAPLGRPDAARATAPTWRREVVVRVSDEGMGIPDDIRQRIFDPFFTTKAPGRGTGLGLAMVASIVKRAGGAIEVESEVGRGTTFAVVLPAAAGDAAPVGAPEAPAPARMSGVVLLVDDDVLVRRVARRMLERAGYTVLEAIDGAAALAVAERADARIDLLLTDLMMPGLSGRDVIARFRTLRPGTPIICVTGFAAEREDGSSIAPEVRAIVAKPFTADSLTRAVAGALAESRRS